MRAGALAITIALALCGAARAQDLPPRLARALGIGSSDVDAPLRVGWPRRWPRAPLDDRASEASGATIAWSRFGTMGRGATVCVVDTGVDLRHRDFLDPAGHTRAAWLVDLEGAPRGERADLEARFGAAIWSAASIDAALAAGSPLPGDVHGHGTAIASAAVGDDASDGPPGPLAGVAPEASLVVVRAWRAGAEGFEDEDVVHGVEACFALGEPSRTVALIALGGHDGAHDGTEPLERALAAIAATGSAIVAAAGNDGGRAIHASGRAIGDEPALVDLHVPSPRGAGEHRVAVVLRTSGRVAIESPDGARVEARAGEIAMVGGLVVDSTAPIEDAAVVRVAIAGGGALPEIRGGEYSISIAEAPFDAWIVDAQLGDALGACAFRGDHAVEGEEVTIPATSPAILAVGASVSRDAYRDVAYEARDDGSAASSSRGPSPTGAPRPDLIAPGGIVLAALSSDLVPGDETNLVHGERAILDGRAYESDRIAIEGSSVAAAIVAGAHALAYSLAPASESDRALLVLSARAEQAWTPQAGMGALRVDAWLAARQGLAVEGASALSLTRATVLPRARDVFAVARVLDADGLPVDGEIVLRANGRELARATLTDGIAQAPLEIDGAAGDRITVDAITPDGTLLSAGELEVRVDEGPGGIARPGGGACNASGSSSASAWLITLALVTSLRSKRRR